MTENCPLNKIGLKGDADNSHSCLATGSPDADYRGFSYDPCDCVLKDYRLCLRHQRYFQSKTSNPDVHAEA